MPKLARVNSRWSCAATPPTKAVHAWWLRVFVRTRRGGHARLRATRVLLVHARWAVAPPAELASRLRWGPAERYVESIGYDDVTCTCDPQSQSHNTFFRMSQRLGRRARTHPMSRAAGCAVALGTVLTAHGSYRSPAQTHVSCTARDAATLNDAEGGARPELAAHGVGTCMPACVVER